MLQPLKRLYYQALPVIYKLDLLKKLMNYSVFTADQEI